MTPGDSMHTHNKKTTWILVRQEVHTLGIGTGNMRASRTRDVCTIVMLVA